MQDSPIEPQRYYELYEQDTIKFGNIKSANNHSRHSDIDFCITARLFAPIIRVILACSFGMFCNRFSRICSREYVLLHENSAA